jgi:GNAT superfamily N-acetyltransferase
MPISGGILWLNSAMTELQWSFHNPPDDEDISGLRAELVKHNLQASSIAQSMDMAVFVHDSSGRLVGGITGNLWGGVLEIDFLWLHTDLRGQGLGAQILSRLEEEAVARGGSVAFLNTFSFQAPGFYQKSGYQVIDVVDGYPDGVKKLFFKKNLR